MHATGQMTHGQSTGSKTSHSVVVGSDHAGFELKNRLVEYLVGLGHQVEDLGATSRESTDYPDYAHKVAVRVAQDSRQTGILVCGSGQGMVMAANRHVGVRAALCQEPYSAMMARQHNDANVLCLGARVVGPGLAVATVDAFLAAEFEGGRHERRVSKIELTAECGG